MSVSTIAGRRQRVLVVDNVDSFTFSLVDYFRVAGAEVTCAREPGSMRGWDLVVLSPGPGRPEEHPACMRALAEADGPVFGVCLGLQAMVLALGGTVVRAPRPVHGWSTPIEHDGTGVFRGMPSPFRATRYHSLCAGVVPAGVRVNAWSEGVVMGIEVADRGWSAVQFHPESVRTKFGREAIGSLLRSG